MILPVLTELRYAMDHQARLARALMDGVPAKPMPDCIIVRSSDYPLRDERYQVCIGDCNTRFATLADAVAHAREVLQPMSAQAAINDYLAKFSGAKVSA